MGRSLLSSSKSWFVFAAVGLLSGHIVSALDVQVQGIECDKQKPVSVDLSIECGGRSSCTFGDDIYVTGTLYYNGVENSGTDGETMYVTIKLDLMVLEFSLLDMTAIPLCYEGQQYNNAEYYEWNQQQNYDQGGNQDEVEEEAEEEEQQQYYDGGEQNNYDNGGGRRRRLQDNGCPGNGAYPFSTTYTLPSAGTAQVSWLATGWTGTGYMKAYAQNDDAYQIGSCEMTIGTSVTHSSTDGFLHTPSAATSVAMILALLAAVSVLWLFCYCRGYRQRPRLDAEDDVTSSFRRIEDTKRQKLVVDVPSPQTAARLV